MKKRLTTQALKKLREQASVRQARWKEKSQAAGLVRKTFLIAAEDWESFKKMATASRNSALVRQEKKS